MISQFKNCIQKLKSLIFQSEVRYTILPIFLPVHGSRDSLKCHKQFEHLLERRGRVPDTN